MTTRFVLLLSAACGLGCRSVELQLHADVPDGTTAIASLAFEEHTLTNSLTACFEQSLCQLTMGPSDVEKGHQGPLLAWADPENDDLDLARVDDRPPAPEDDEPRAEVVVDLPLSGTVELTLNLE